MVVRIAAPLMVVRIVAPLMVVRIVAPLMVVRVFQRPYDSETKSMFLPY